MKYILQIGALMGLLAAAGCATLGGIGLLPPTFELSNDQASELRLVGPSLERPVGGAILRLNAVIGNPNPVGVTLVTLAGRLQLEGRDAADVELPLGLPLQAGESSVVPLDISISFANLPLLAEALPRAVNEGSVDYTLRGTVGVDAGMLGQPTFGPMTFFEGTVAARR